MMESERPETMTRNLEPPVMGSQQKTCRLHARPECLLCYDGTYSLDLSNFVNRMTVSNFLERTRKPNGKEAIHARANRRREFARRIRQQRSAAVDDVIVLSSDDDGNSGERAAANQPLEEQANDATVSSRNPAKVPSQVHLLTEPASLSGTKSQVPGQLLNSAQSLVDPTSQSDMTAAMVPAPVRNTAHSLRELFSRIRTAEQAFNQIQHHPNSAQQVADPFNRISATKRGSAPTANPSQLVKQIRTTPPGPHQNDSTLLHVPKPANYHSLTQVSEVTPDQADLNPKVISVPSLSQPSALRPSRSDPPSLNSCRENPSTHSKPVSMAESRNETMERTRFMKTPTNRQSSMAPSMDASRPRPNFRKALQPAGIARPSVIKTNPLVPSSPISQPRFTKKPGLRVRKEGSETGASKPICYELNEAGVWQPRVCEHDCCVEGVMCETVKCVTKNCPGLRGRRTSGDMFQNGRKLTRLHGTRNISAEKCQILSRRPAELGSILNRRYQAQQTAGSGGKHSSNPASEFRSAGVDMRVSVGEPSLGPSTSSAGSYSHGMEHFHTLQRPTVEEPQVVLLPATGMHNLNVVSMSGSRCYKTADPPSMIPSPSACVKSLPGIHTASGVEYSSQPSPNAAKPHSAEHDPADFPASAPSSQPNPLLPSTLRPGNEGVSTETELCATRLSASPPAGTELLQQSQPLPPFETISSKSHTSGIKEYWSHSDPFEDGDSFGSQSDNLERACTSVESTAESPTALPATGEESVAMPENIAPASDTLPIIHDSTRAAAPSLLTRRNRRKPAAPKKKLTKPKYSVVQGTSSKPRTSHRNRQSEDFIVLCEGRGFKIKSSTVEQASPVIKQFADECCEWMDVDGEEYRAFEIIGVPYWAMSQILRFVCRTEYNHGIMRSSHMKRLLEKFEIKYRQSNTFIFLDN